MRIDRERSHHPLLLLFTGARGAFAASRDSRNESPGMIPIKVPPLGESIVEATISRWLKREGEAVTAGETLVELETDKVTVEVPATTSGVLVRRAHQEGDVVALGAVLGELDESAAGKAAPAPTAAQSPSPAAPPPAAEVKPAPEPPAPPPAKPAEEVRASPAARRLSAEEGVDLASVQGTGRGGVVSKPDVVEQALRPAATGPGAPQPAVEVMPPPRVMPAAPAPAAAPAAKATPAAPPSPPPSPLPAGNGTRETREKMSTRRKRIAEHLLESQHATAHLTTFNEIDMTAVEALRGRVKERIEKEQGVRLSFMPFFVRAACMALKQFPVVNARVDGDHIVFHHYVNLGIAVASDAGLVVPNIKDADRKGMVQIGRDIVELAKKARDGKLVMDDLTGGTFTITNGGVFGSLVSTPIINFPQAGILGLHKIQDRPVAIDGKVEIRPMMYVALSYDHRIIDGQQAVLFLVRVKELMEDPALMVID
jgi:2-oxoglutarate dehydrogenase E2 component (dihydrolipoamide succinyltransferase)